MDGTEKLSGIQLDDLIGMIRNAENSKISFVLLTCVFLV